MKSEIPQPEKVTDSDVLAAMIDELMSSGTQHLNLEMGDVTRIQTVNSTDCGGKPGACAVPNFECEDSPQESDGEWDDDDF